MKKSLFTIFVLLTSGILSNSVLAGITTYTFTSKDWQSKQGTTVCDGKTDGWTCDKEAYGYSGSYSIGVQVTSKLSGAGATTVRSFSDVRRVSINYATTTKGAGTIRIQVGDNAPIDSVVRISTTNTDLTIVLPAAQTGKISLQVNCSRNSIYVNSVSIRSADGASPEFTQSRFQLVTDIRQLKDSGQIMFGIADGSTNKIMGYYDETVSQNNIHAIAGVYNADRTIINNNDNAIYTLWKAENEQGDTIYIIQDELRYEEAYLVAGGGKTKNKLTLWTDYSSPQYGLFGVWAIRIAPTGEATIENQGSSVGRYLQYNAGDQLFSCYSEPQKFTPVAIYQEVSAIGTERPAIAATAVHFGEVCISGAEATGQKSITVNAILLSEDIHASLRHGDIFNLSASTIDRDGDELTVSYHVSEPGLWLDTIDLATQDTAIYVPVTLRAVRQMSIAEAVRSTDFASVYLNPVTVTKKYDTYIFVRDESGSMLIYDTHNAQDKPYGQGLERGHVLNGVHGRFQNYYGVPELMPSEAWTVEKDKAECLPDSGMSRIDSTDVCRYIALDSVVFAGAQCQYRGKSYAVADKFNIGAPVENRPTRVEAIVSYDWNVVTLWIIRQTLYPPTTGVLSPIGEDEDDSAATYTILGMPTGNDYKGIKVQKGRKTLVATPF